jgi:hypothetical protein
MVRSKFTVEIMQKRIPEGGTMKLRSKIDLKQKLEDFCDEVFGGESTDRSLISHPGVTRRAILELIGLLVAGRALDMFHEYLVPHTALAKAVVSISIRNFLALSSLLTSVENLDPGVGKMYLESLEINANSHRGLMSILERGRFGSTGEVKTLDELAKTGVFEDTAMRTVADTIVENWFSGIYDTAHGRRVADWTGALAWTTSYTKAIGMCSSASFNWTTKPDSI